MSEKNDTTDIPTLTERELAELRSMYGVYQVNRAIERLRCLEAELTQRTAEREVPTSITRCMVRLDGVWITPDAALDEITRLRAEVAIRDADVSDLKFRLKELGGRLDGNQKINERLRADLAQRTSERDKTRRLYCIEMSRQSLDPKRFTPERSAKERGWDCFEKEAKP